MSVRIEPLDAFKLKMSGHIETVMPLSTRAVSYDFAVAFSDGTLLGGCYDFACRVPLLGRDQGRQHDQNRPSGWRRSRRIEREN